MIDIGANLTHESFQHDFMEVVSSARNAGLSHILITGTDAASSEAALQLASIDPGFFSSTAGYHPHVASQFNEDSIDALKALLARETVVAVGETGLDYNRNFSPPDTQRTVFRRHLELASELGKPVFLHQRDAHQDFLPLLREFRQRLPGGVVHCFTDTLDAMQAYLDLDMHIGITGWICDERRGTDLQAIAKHIPLERLLVESDAPYLLPRNLQPRPKNRRNEPKYLTAVVEKLAQCMEQDPDEVRRAATENATRLFGLAERSARDNRDT